MMDILSQENIGNRNLHVMRAELFLHGTPNGQCVYSSYSDHDDYVLSYYRYDIGIGSQSLVVETKVLNNNLNCYYTYYIYNVQALDGRPGGYFAITLRSDTFVRNLQVMFQLMDIIYNQLVVGTILSGGNVNKYLVQSFNDQGKHVFDVFKNILLQVIKAHNIVKIDDSFLGNSGSPLSFNPCDNRCVDLLAYYKSAERIIISPSSSLPREQQRAREYQQKIEYVKKESEDRLKKEIINLQAEIHSLQREKKGYEVQISDAGTKIKSLYDANMDLKKRLSEYEMSMKSLTNRANIKEELEKISAPLLRLNDLLQGFRIPHTSQRLPHSLQIELENALENSMPSNKPAKLTVFFSFIAVVLLLVVIAFQFVLVFRENDLLFENNSIETIPEKKLTEEKETSPEPMLVNDFNNVIINIRDYHGNGSLQYGKIYSLYISNRGHSNRTDSIKGLRWECDGGEVYQNGGNDARLRLKKKNGFIKIICYLPNGESIVRSLEVSSNENIKTPDIAPIPKMMKDENSIPSSKNQNQASSRLKG